MFYIILLIGIAALVLNILDEDGKGLARSGRRLLPHVYPFLTGFCLSYCVILYYEASHRPEPAKQETSSQSGSGSEESPLDTDEEADDDLTSDEAEVEEGEEEEEEEDVEEDVQPVKGYT